ncbi:DUF4955 domain-containing protein [Flavivirga algicola]|uniref:DUF4955 domain-containing protein n=1 Tax=Flavivirga algicola TaxID=2729136 RepID=A0ABX1RXS0_9FLAO|nr:DUF4955 domain-containing protein [Flavivirga algicola]NMH88382.1 DUF4955 domain-containing protein [Flavivirga algicola]
MKFRYKSSMISRIKISAAIIIFVLVSSCKAQEKAQIWQSYVTQKSTGKPTSIIDYSYAGYAFGEVGIPNSSVLNYPIFDVTTFGAIANDTIADDFAIAKAINAAEKKGKGVVFFPKGRFVVNKGEHTKGFEINSSNIILKGAGAGLDGTEIFMQDYMRHDKSLFKWTSPHMFTFKPKNLNVDTFCSTNIDSRPYPYVSKIVEDSKLGSKTIYVEDAKRFAGQSHIILVMPYNKESIIDFMGTLQTRPQWERINSKGIAANEIHKIASIKENTITLEKPLLTDIKKKYGWYVAPHEVIEACGFEDIHFIGNFQESFVHHKNKIHDGGWKGVKMAHVSNGWVRRCVFSNVNSAVGIVGSITSSVIMNVLNGKQGHGSVEMTFGTRNFVGLWKDDTDKGQWHGIDASHLAAGNVAWRIYAQKGRGFDLHSGSTRQTLYDCYEGYNMSGNGGNYKMEPHHLNGFTLWNFKQYGPAVANYNYWSLQPRKDNPQSPYWGFAISNPYIVGFHGANTTFNEASLGYVESIGKKVLPESLYEAQLTYRMGERPDWIDTVLETWEKWYKEVVKK